MDDYTEQLEDAHDGDSVKPSYEVAAVNPDVELDTQIEQMMLKKGSLWECKSCGKPTKLKNNWKNHIETHIDGVSHVCHICNKSSSTRISLAVHISAYIPPHHPYPVHISAYHSSQLFDCNTCGTVGMSKMVFKGHKLTHRKQSIV